MVRFRPRPAPGNGAFVVEKAKIVVHEADQPGLVGDLLDPDGLPGEHGAQVDLVIAEADATTAGDDSETALGRVQGDGCAVAFTYDQIRASVGVADGRGGAGGERHAGGLHRRGQLGDVRCGRGVRRVGRTHFHSRGGFAPAARGRCPAPLGASLFQGTIRRIPPSPPPFLYEIPQFDVYNAPSGPVTSPFGRLANPASTTLRSPVLGSNLTRLALSVVH